MEPVVTDAAQHSRNPSTVERRKHRRSQVTSMGITSLYSSHQLKGSLLNISKHGLAFRYMTKNGRLVTSGMLNIALLGDSWLLKDIPFERVWDTSISYDFSFGTVIFGQCGVRFGKLTDAQVADLEKVIRYHTCAPCDNREKRQSLKDFSVGSGKTMVLLSFPTN